MTKHPPSLPRLLYRVSEVAQMAGISRSNAYALIASGELPSVKIGGAVRVRAEDLAAWIADLETERQEQFGIKRVA